MRLSRFRIGTRLGVGFGLMILITLLMAGFGLKQLWQMQVDLDDIVLDNNRKVELNQTMSEQVHIVARVMRTLILLDDQQAKEREVPKITAARKAYDDAWTSLQALPASARGAQLRRAIEESQVQARRVNDQVIELALADRDDEARDLLVRESISATQKWQDALDANIAFQAEANRSAYQHASASGQFGIVLLAVLAATGVVVAVVVAWKITTSVTGPIEYVRQCAIRMADGDLSQRVERRAAWDGQDETSQLIRAMQSMHDSLCKLVAEVHANAASVASAAQQIAQGNADLSSRTEEQASNLQQTAASMEQLTATVKQNAESAQHANALTRDATEVVSRGGAAMGEVVGTMRGIHEGSQKIAEIIGVIDGIAFQTNILALNAAVEAARAGEQGRGFAVVASEVRALAQRSASAAREIKSLISESVERVATGTQQVEKAGSTIEEVVQSIARVTDLVAEITAASNEQASGITQVGDAVTQMDQMTQQNAALVEESAAAAESLNAQAKELVGAVSKFRLATA